MAKIYEALQEAQREADAQDTSAPSTLPGGTKRSASLRDSMLSIYQSVAARAREDGGMVVAFMGSRAGEGVSSLAREFSRFVAREMGHPVALVDAEHGFGRHGESLGFSLGASMHEALAEGKPVTGAIRPAGDGALHVGLLLKPGNSLPNLASGGVLNDIFAQLRNEYRIVVLDSPPVQEASDALLLVKHTDAVVFVVEAERTRWQVARGVCEKLRKQGADILGVILNKRRYYIPQAIYRRL